MKGRELSNVGCWGLTGSDGGFLGEEGRSQKRMRRSKGQEEMEQGIDEIGGCQNLEHPQQLWQILCHFTTLKTYFIILPRHFTTSYLSDVLSFNSIH